VSADGGRPSRASRTTGALGAIAGMIGLSAVVGVLVTILVTPVIVVAGSGAGFGVQAFNTIPEALEIGEQAQTSELFATRGGEPVKLAEFFSQDRQEVGWDEVAQSAKDAAIATEDPRFYEHAGVDSFAAIRAVFQNVSGGGIESGASTITMQYVRNVLVQQAEEQLESGDPEVVAAGEAAYEEATVTTLPRKLREIKMAIGVEERFEKDEILLAYLNIANYGGRVYGIESAAQYYFGIPAAELTPAQSASLVATVNSPADLRIDDEANIPLNTERRDLLLANMNEQGMLDDAEYTTAVETPVQPTITPATSGCANTQPASAAYFCDYVRSEILNHPAFGETADERAALLNRGGLRVMTTLDLDVQDAAAGTLQAQVPGSVAFADLGGSLVSTEARTGRIVAMAQNTAYGSSQDAPGTTQVNYAADSSHGGSTGFQVGSTYKAFTLVDWLRNGNSLYDVVRASKNAWNTSEFSSCQGGFGTAPYNVTNDTGGARSDMTPLRATTQSVNTAFIAMASELDLCDIAGAAADLGVANADGRDLSIYPSDVLGSGANTIAPLQMASAFGSIANGGVTCSPVAIDSVTRPDGSTVTPPAADCREAVDPAVAATTAFALRSVVAPGGTGAASNPGDGIPLMGKTGTTDNAKDTWMVGSTTEIATAIWVGNVQGEVSMRRNQLPGGGADTARHRVFQPYMQSVNALYGGQAFPAPSAALTERPAPPPPPAATPGPTDRGDEGDRGRAGEGPEGDRQDADDAPSGAPRDEGGDQRRDDDRGDGDSGDTDSSGDE
jgi:membrane peptidoglycan carboxypeptidase